MLFRSSQQLVGWKIVPLAAGEAEAVTVKLEPLLLSVYDPQARHWVQPKGRYEIHVGSSERNTPLSATFAAH